jgi:spermidine synthase
VGDARQILEQVPAASFDLVISDVFAGGRTPAHLTSVEFAAAAGRALHQDGVLCVNAADGGALAHARAQAATVRSVFPDVCVIADPAVLRGRRFGNLVLAGSRATLPVAALTRLAAADPFPGRVLHGADLMKFIAGARPVTDAAAQPSPRVPRDVFAG